MKTLFMRFPEGRAKALTLSYDDGVEQDLHLMEILDRYGLKATFNLISGCFAPEDKVYPAGTIHRRLTASKVAEAYGKNGHEVAVHSLTHPFLETLPAANVAYEIVRDRENLEKMFGVIVRGMAYPMGTFSDEVVSVLRSCGIAYARTTVSTEKFDIPTDWLRLPATCHHKNPNLMPLAQKFLNAPENKKPMLFYLWGHSYEFEADGNWDVIEKFAELTGGKDSIWYANNLEIYDYIADFKRLYCSVDGSRMHNPTNRTLWFLYNSKIVSIAPGETISL